MKYALLCILLISQTSFAQKIVAVEQVAQLTGQPSINNTGSVNVYGTDLGSMFLHSDGKVYFLFGDTFGPPGNPGASGDWRSNTMAFTSDTVAADGIVFDGWITDTNGNAKALIRGDHHQNDGSGEVTKIPTSGWSILSRQYLWYMSVKQWLEAGNWQVNDAEIAYSDDNGNTWISSGVKRLPNSNFIQVTVADHLGYLYFWGIPAGRFGGVKIARVPPSKVLDLSAYQYYSGSEWTSGEENATEIIEAPVGELSVLWNPFLDRWIMMYLNENKACIEIREAEQPQGPWSTASQVVCGTDYPGLYGAFMHNQYMENEGETIYFLMSQWGPYNVILMKVRFEQNSTAIENQDLIPELYSLDQNHPNPFHQETQIRYKLLKSSHASIRIYNMNGQAVYELINRYHPAGSYLLHWGGKDHKGNQVKNGIYFSQLMVGRSIVKTKKIALIKSR